MPLIAIEQPSPDAMLGLWNMSDDVAACGVLYDEAAVLYKSESRRREYVCVRLLLRAMLGDPIPTISHDPNGRPRLSNGINISISHTRDVCAAVVSERQTVAVDVEYISDRVGKVASHFLRNDEHASETVPLLLHWCAKETVYKLFPDDNLAFEDMQVMSMQAQQRHPAVANESSMHREHGVWQCQEAGTMLVRHHPRMLIVNVAYRIYPAHILTYAFRG